MFHAIKIVIVCGFAHYVAYFVLSRLTGFDKELKRYVIVSTVVIAVAVLSRHVMLAYLVTIYFCITHNRTSDPSQKIAYFFGMAFTISYFAGVDVNPGIQIGGISHPRVLVLTLLFPLLFTVRSDPKIRRFNDIDKTVFCFFIWIALLNIRAPTITGMLRQNLWLVLDYVVPYIVIRRYLTNYSLVLASLSFALVSQAATGIAEAVFRWHIHTDIERLSNFADPVMAQYKLRGAFLRVQASFMNPLIFALFANMSFLTCVIYFGKIGFKPPPTYTRFWAWAGLGITALGTISSGSRAGVAGSFLIVLVSMVLLWAIKRERDPKRLMVTGAFASIITVWFTFEEFLRAQFWYRVQLVEVSWDVIWSQPILGSPHVRDDPRMQVLHLGEGIIDIVNTYLEFALSYGVPAFVLFVMAIFKGLSQLYDNLRHAEGEKLAFGIFAFASLFILAFNLATASAFGWTYPWIWICIAIGSNIVARVKAERREAWEKENGPLF